MQCYGLVLKSQDVTLNCLTIFETPIDDMYLNFVPSYTLRRLV